jgi:hypothetical protein
MEEDGVDTFVSQGAFLEALAQEGDTRGVLDAVVSNASGDAIVSNLNHGLGGFQGHHLEAQAK